MPDRPNILFLLADDLGWRDLSCYGSTFYETPNLDRLAEQSCTFTDAYAACPVCSPTRASLLTGRYPAQVGVTDYIDWSGKNHPRKGKVIDAPYLDHVPDKYTTYAQALRDRGGYQTWHIGKWHCGGEGSLPHQRGFDVNVGGCEWGMPGGGFFAPWKVPDPELQKANQHVPEGTFLDEYLADRAVELIKNRDTARPFLMNFWFYLVHTPIQAPRHLIEKYEAKAKRMKLDQIDPYVEGETISAEHMQDKPVVRRMIQSHPVYAAMVEMMDICVGRILDALEEAGEADNTMGIFSSDNGGLSTKEGSPTCNLPLSEGKGWMYDGGTREPYLVKLPGVTRPGSTSHATITSPDLFPTLLEAAGLDPMPEDHADGVSMMPALRGDADFDRGSIFWHYPHYGNQGGTPSCAVRRGPWKLIRFFEDDRCELYHLDDDISESRDLTAEQPARVEELKKELAAWQDRMGARFPEVNPDYVEPTHPAADPRV
ncbi:MAG: sulfatase [Phycisphaeraceae bacterium]